MIALTMPDNHGLTFGLQTRFTRSWIASAMPLKRDRV